MARRARSGDRGFEPCAHSSQNRTNRPPPTSSRPPDGSDGREPGMLGDRKAVGFDIDGNRAIQP